MDASNIEKMTVAVVDALGLSAEKAALVREALQTVWVGQIAVIWTREDVIAVCEENGWARPSALESEDVLNEVLLNNTGAGITRDCIARQIRESGLDRQRRSI
jgi:hypothetical protein